jgi:hypothetical protein
VGKADVVDADAAAGAGFRLAAATVTAAETGKGDATSAGMDGADAAATETGACVATGAVCGAAARVLCHPQPLAAATANTASKLPAKGIQRERAGREDARGRKSETPAAVAAPLSISRNAS